MAPAPSATPKKTARPESFESQQRRDNAAEILESYEKLSWVSFNRDETIAQTRHYFQRIVAGFDPTAAEPPYWKNDLTPHIIEEELEQPAPASKKGKEPPAGQKGKKKVTFAFFEGKTFVDAPLQPYAPRHRKERPTPAAAAEGSAGDSSSKKRQHPSEMDTT